MLRAVRFLRFGALAVVVAWVGSSLSCGSANEGSVTATGGEVCSLDRRVCLEIPVQGLDEAKTFRISSPSSDRPGGELSEVWDIEALETESLKFRKPAIVKVKLEAVTAPGEQRGEDQLLRIFISRDGVWEVIGDHFFDRVRNELRGSTLLLSNKSAKRAISAVAVLRGDRLPDGGIPIETDAGMVDSGMMYFPPLGDGGQRDAGVDAGTPPVDAGRPDSGVDAGMPVDAGTDAGTPVVDAGFDAGTPVVDAGVDAGTPVVDAGVDAGTPVIDAGVDAGTPVVDAGVDAGTPEVDAGFDAGTPVDAGHDAGSIEDAGEPDAGDAG